MQTLLASIADAALLHRTLKPGSCWTHFAVCPAEVCINMLACRVFKPILQQCYYSNGERDNYFVFELTKNEAKGLISKFEAQTISTRAPQRLPAPSQVRLGLMTLTLTYTFAVLVSPVALPANCQWGAPSMIHLHS